MYRVAVVGAGPSGIYTAAALTQQERHPVAVDVVDRLPTPFGLVRYGVAPDHASIRGVRTTLERVLAHERVRFLGNVELGRDVSLVELAAGYDAVVLAYGCGVDKRLGIPGEEMPGSVSALDVVSWYTGHPDADVDRMGHLIGRARSVAVIGAGNVALDVVRVLSCDSSELGATDMPRHVLDTLAASPVRRVDVLGRRGPGYASFTTVELAELGELAGVRVEVDAADLDLDVAESEHVAGSRVAQRNLAVLAGWTGPDHAGEAVRRGIRLRFRVAPVRIIGEPGYVRAVEVMPTGSDGGAGTAQLPADLVVRAIGYRAVPVDGLPFDEARGIVPSDGQGRVLADGLVQPGLYLVGWLKRGPSGLIGTNRGDATATVSSLLDDVDAGLLKAGGETPDRAGLDDVLRARAVTTTDLSGWHRIDAAEIALGRAHGRARITMHERASLLRAATDLP